MADGAAILLCDEVLLASDLPDEAIFVDVQTLPLQEQEGLIKGLSFSSSPSSKQIRHTLVFAASAS